MDEIIKELNKKDLLEIIYFLLDWLEDEHMGVKGKVKEEIAQMWGIDL